MSQKLQVRAKLSRKTILFVYMHFCIFSDFVFVSLTFYGVICLLSGIRVISNTKLFNRIINIGFFGPDPARPGGPRRAGPALQSIFYCFICRHKYDFVQTCVYMFFYYVCWFLSRSNDAEFGRRVVTCRDMNPKCVEFDKEGARAPPPHPPLYIPYIFHIYFLNIFHIFSLVFSYFIQSQVGPDMTEVRLLVQFACFGSKTNFLE